MAFTTKGPADYLSAESTFGLSTKVGFQGANDEFLASPTVFVRLGFSVKYLLHFTGRYGGDVRLGGELERLRDSATVVDAMGGHIYLPTPPQCIMDLTPRAVETLFARGAGSAVAGREASGILFPPEAVNVPKVDSLEAILKLRSDLIIRHPNHHRFTLPMLEQLGVAVLLIEFRSVQEVLANITTLGAASGRTQEAGALRSAVQERLHTLRASEVEARPRLLLLFGTPRSFLVMGETTFAGDLLRLAGG